MSIDFKDSAYFARERIEKLKKGLTESLRAMIVTIEECKSQDDIKKAVKEFIPRHCHQAQLHCQVTIGT